VSAASSSLSYSITAAALPLVLFGVFFPVSMFLDLDAFYELFLNFAGDGDLSFFSNTTSLVAAGLFRLEILSI